MLSNGRQQFLTVTQKFKKIIKGEKRHEKHKKRKEEKHF